MAIKRRKPKNTPLAGPGALVTTRVVTVKVNASVRDERVLQDLASFPGPRRGRRRKGLVSAVRACA